MVISVNFFEKLNRANSARVGARGSDRSEGFLSLKVRSSPWIRFCSRKTNVNDENKPRLGRGKWSHTTGVQTLTIGRRTVPAAS